KRRSVIEDRIEELMINIDVTVASEDVLVSVTQDGYLKRTSLRSYGASNGEDLAIKNDDHLVGLIELNTTDKLLLFTNKGKYLSIPVHELPDILGKDICQHLSTFAPIESDEYVIQCVPIRAFTEGKHLLLFTKDGMIKRSELRLYDAQRYSR